ncbi:MAG: hypothetical protein OXH00_21650 [Candidatus Poribacteria bacterium]|nr:hypothetical protein [Candidatus Poribacteria bacterium]
MPFILDGDKVFQYEIYRVKETGEFIVEQKTQARAIFERPKQIGTFKTSEAALQAMREASKLE